MPKVNQNTTTEVIMRFRKKSPDGYKVTREIKQDILTSKLKVAELAIKHGLGASTVYLVINSRNLKQII